MNATGSTPLLDDRFLFLETLGRGGMGSVYRAFDRAEQRIVALKVPEDSGPAGGEHPMAAEFDAWRRVRHPNIVRLYEMGHARRGPLPAGTPYLILESFPGRPAHRAFSPGGLDPERLESLARDVLLALRHVHEAGLVHRDLKPGNILVATSRRRASRVKLTDFGLAVQAGRTGEPGKISGSIPYLSPESLLGLPLDGRSDLYGLGIALFFLAAGRMPVESREPAEVLLWHLDGPAPEPREALPLVPERLARFVLRLMSRRPCDRPDSAHDALRSLGVAQAARTRTFPAGVDRGDIAALRLAVDAARRGERRVLRLPAGRTASAALVREARAMAQMRGLRFLPLRGRPGTPTSNLGALVLRLLLDHGDRAGVAFERYAIPGLFPLSLVGGHPVWDAVGRTRAESSPELPRPAPHRVAGLFLEAASEQPIVLHLVRSARADPLACAVARVLTESCGREVRGFPRAGGMLVVVEDAAGTPAMGNAANARRRVDSSRDGDLPIRSP